jgi:hypothetical protein
MKRSFFIAGVQFRPKGDIAIAGAKLKEGDILTLAPEPTNKFDPNAVQIFTNYKTAADETTTDNHFIGYVPKKYSSEVSALLGIDAPVQCTVDEVNPAAKTYEMFKVTVSIPLEGVNEELLKKEVEKADNKGFDALYGLDGVLSSDPGGFRL